MFPSSFHLDNQQPLLSLTSQGERNIRRHWFSWQCKRSRKCVKGRTPLKINTPLSPFPVKGERGQGVRGFPLRLLSYPLAQLARYTCSVRLKSGGGSWLLQERLSHWMFARSCPGTGILRSSKP